VSAQNLASQPERHEKRSLWNVWITGATSFLTDVSTEMTYPLLPLFLTATLGASPAILGVIEGIAESVASLLKAFSGYVSDRVGRRKPLAILGYALSPLSKFLLYVAGSWPVVLVARVLDRFGKGIRTAPRDALIAESVEPEKRGRAFGLHRTLDTLGAAFGVLLAMGLLMNLPRSTHVVRSIFLYSVVPAALGVLVLFLVREVKAHARAGSLHLSWRELDPVLKQFLIITFIFSLGNSSNQFILLRASTLGTSTFGVLGLYLAFNLSYALFSYPAGRISDRFGRRRVIVPGYLFYALVYFLLAFSKSTAHFLAIFILYGLYMALTEGVEKALVSDLARPEIKASALGVHATLVGIGLFPASALGGWLWNAISPRATFYFGSAMGVAGALGMAFVLRELDNPQVQRRNR